MKLLLDILLLMLLVVGCAFTFLGAFALVKLPTFFQRLHGPTKASTLGVGCLLAASVLYHGNYGTGLHPREMLISVFLFLTAPVSAHLMSKAALALQRGVGTDPPVPGTPVRPPRQPEEVPPPEPDGDDTPLQPAAPEALQLPRDEQDRQGLIARQDVRDAEDALDGEAVARDVHDADVHDADTHAPDGHAPDRRGPDGRGPRNPSA